MCRNLPPTKIHPRREHHAAVYAALKNDLVGLHMPERPKPIGKWSGSANLPAPVRASAAAA